MSITDELREWWVRKFPVMDKELHKDFTAIDDRIDAEYQKALDEWKAKHGQMWLKGYSECHAEMLEGNETFASELERCGWIRLPKDTDGEYIHIGDVMERMERCGKVVALQLSDNPWGDGNHWAIQLEGEKAPTVLDAFFHHHEPTVEDVLDEFASAYDRIGGEDEEHQKYLDLIAEYAAKLKLKEPSQ